MIFVDDNSPDGTTDAVRAIGAADARVRCLRRVGRRGLSGACIEGILASQARFAAVMDADLQHDERILPAMLAKLRAGEGNVAVGTRYAEGGSADSFSRRRHAMSRGATHVANAILGVRLSDPMSGFFMLERRLVEEIAPDLSTQGFKILLDILSTAGDKARVVELPFRFGNRQSGESKLDARVMLDYLGLVLSKATYDVISLRFIFFCLVGIVGIGVHFFALTAGVELFRLPFNIAQTVATLVAIASNFLLNNTITYRDQRLTGRAFMAGLIRFYVISSVGALSNISVGTWLFSHDQTWWSAGLGGAIMSVIWNYVISSLIVWRSR